MISDKFKFYSNELEYKIAQAREARGNVEEAERIANKLESSVYNHISSCSDSELAMVFKDHIGKIVEVLLKG